MFYQAELLDEELSIYRRAATQLYGNVTASRLVRIAEKGLEPYKAGKLKLQDDRVQSLIRTVRVINRKEGFGPPGYEGWIHAASMQDLLGWKNLTVADREAFSEYIEAERTCLQTMSDPDPEQALQALDLNPEHNDPVYRAARHIKSPAHLQLFYEKSAVGSQSTARARITADAEILTSRRLCTPREGPEKPVASGAEIGAMSQGIRCKHVYYCNEECQTSEWTAKHKHICKLLAALNVSR